MRLRSSRVLPMRSRRSHVPFHQTSTRWWIVSRAREIIGIIRLKDVLKPGIREKIQSVKVMGIRPVMLTGDQPLTAKSIASEVGIDEYRPEAKPEDKYDIVTKEQAETRVVAMIGDGTNDAPALAVAD